MLLHPDGPIIGCFSCGSISWRVVAAALATKRVLAEPEEKLAKLRRALAEAPGVNARVIVDVIPEIEYIIGPRPPAPELGPAETQNRFILTFQRFLGVFAREEHPLVVFVDDLQWADAPSLSLMRSLRARVVDLMAGRIGRLEEAPATP